jgi:hypothetical protein
MIVTESRNISGTSGGSSMTWHRKAWKAVKQNWRQWVPPLVLLIGVRVAAWWWR